MRFTPRAGRREWIALAVLALPTLLVTMDLSVLFLAVPELTRDLSPSSAALLWITDIYGFLIAGSLITMGTLGDRLGRRRLLLGGGAMFALASLLAAFSTSPAMLIAARALQGLAGATLAPSSLALIRNLFVDPDQRTLAIGVWMSCFAAGAALGPVVGGVLLEQFWWGSVFLVNVPVMALLLAVGPWLLPESRDPQPGRFDLPGAGLSVAAVLALIFGIKRIAEDGAGWPAALSIAAGLTAGAAFVHRQRVTAHPLIDLRLFRAPAFAAALLAMLAAVFVVAGGELFIAQYLQLVRGMSPFEAGLWLLPTTIALIAGSLVAPLIVRSIRAGSAVAGALALGALGMVVLSRVDAGSSLPLLVAAMVLVGLGAGPVGTLGADIVVGAAPPERAGAASGLSETGTELGGALGIALLGSVGTAVYRAELREGAPTAIAQHAIEPARDSLGGAVEAAESLPAGVATELIAAAERAFVQGLQTAAAVGAAAMAVTALVTAVLLRRQIAASTTSTSEAA
jgi:DHA2 family multidrug resistance protein-like MFS transporter